MCGLSPSVFRMRFIASAAAILVLVKAFGLRPAVFCMRSSAASSVVRGVLAGRSARVSRWGMGVELEVGWEEVAAAAWSGGGESVGVVREGMGNGGACALVSGCESFWCLPSLFTLYCGVVCCALRLALLVLWMELVGMGGCMEGPGVSVVA